MKAHPAATIFPMLGDEALKQLAADIAEQGLLEPIELLDGQVVDGRNRLAACKLVDIEPAFIDIDIEEDEVVAYVVSRNLHRRHLTESQRSLVAGRVEDIYAKQAKERQVRKPADSVVENLPQQKGKARDKAGEALGVSGKSVDHAKTVLEHGSKSLIDAVDKGEASVSAAAAVAKSTPREQQDEIVEQGRQAGSVKKAVAKAAKPRDPVDHPLSKAFCKMLSDIVATNNMVREEFGGSIISLMDSPKFDDGERQYVKQMIFALLQTFKDYHKELK